MPSIALTGRVLLTVVLVVLGVVVVLYGVLLALSPGRPRPFVDERGRPVPGGISEKVRVNINGVDQGMFIRGRDRTNPVLLFLHGGTGMPEYFLAQRYPSGLEDYFTVCWWERRGAGLSYSDDIPPHTMTVDQMVSDTLAVANHLRSRFHVQKIYLMAHSGGSLFALQAVARSPELFHAYVGIEQMANQLESENVSLQYMVKHLQEAGDSRMADRLRSVGPRMTIPLPATYMALRDRAMHSLGIGTTRQMRSVVTGVILPSWLCPDYTLAEKLNIWRGKFFSDRLLWNSMLATDLTRIVTSVAVPVYFFHGFHDYTVCYPVTKSYVEALKAPLKGFYTFWQSAHSPIFEEPARMREIIEQDVLKGRCALADRQ